MAEEVESVREDSANRQVQKGLHIEDYSGKRFILPKGADLPTDPRDSEIFNHNGTIKVYIAASSTWVVIGSQS